MRWFLSITLLALFGLAAACSGQQPASAPTAPAGMPAVAASADAQTVVVHKSPT